VYTMPSDFPEPRRAVEVTQSLTSFPQPEVCWATRFVCK